MVTKRRLILFALMLAGLLFGLILMLKGPQINRIVMGIVDPSIQWAYIDCYGCAMDGIEVYLFDTPEADTVVGQLPHDTFVKVSDQRLNSDGVIFYFVETPHYKGWISEYLLTLEN